MCMGGGDADYDSAINAVLVGEARAESAIREMFGKAEGYLQPYLSTGKEAMDTLSDIFLGEGKDLTNIPAFQTLTDTLSKYGIRGLDRSAAAKGLAMSGPQMKGLTNWSQDLALTKSIQPYLAGVGTLYSGGLQSGSSLAGLAGSTGSNLAGVHTGSASNLARIYEQEAQSQAQNQGSWLNELAGGIGLGASLLTAPFTGGTSLSNLFGGSSSLYSPNLLGISNAYNPSTYAGMFLGRAKGGPVRRRRLYIVGEEGPEIFVPDMDGTILPNKEFSSFRRAVNF